MITRRPLGASTRAIHASIPQAETPLPSIPRDSPVSAGSSEKLFNRPRKCVYVHKNGCSTISESLEAKFHLVWLLRHHNHKTPWSCPLRVLREVSVFHMRSTNMDWCLTSYSHVPVWALTRSPFEFKPRQPFGRHRLAQRGWLLVFFQGWWFDPFCQHSTHAMTTSGSSLCANVSVRLKQSVWRAIPCGLRGMCVNHMQQPGR